LEKRGLHSTSVPGSPPILNPELQHLRKVHGLEGRTRGRNSRDHLILEERKTGEVPVGAGRNFREKKKKILKGKKKNGSWH